MQLAKRQLAVAVASALFQPTFVWDLSKGSIVPARGATSANITHTRATVATFEDQDSMVRTVLSGEARFRGLRRTRNLLRFSENFSNAAWLTTGPAVAMTPNMSAPDLTLTATRMTQTGVGTLAGVFQSPAAASGTFRASIWLRRVAGSAAVILRTPTNGDYDISATLTSSWQRFTSTAAAPFGGNAYFVILLNAQNDAIDMWHPQLEDVSGQAVQNPAEYSSVDVLAAPFQGANVDGVKYFPTHNGNVLQQNLFTNTATMTGWNSAGVTVALGQTDPFGGTTAALFTVTDNAGSRSAAQPVFGLTPGQIFTAALWVKSAGTKNTCNIGLYDGTVFYTPVSFAITQGPGSIVDLGTHNLSVSGLSTSQWSKIVISAICGSSGAVDLFCYPGSAGAEQGTTMLLAQPQLQAGRRAGTWVSTTAVAINNNIVEEAVGDTIAGNPGYFREDGRVNLFLRSDNFSATWVLTDTTNNPDVAVSPDGSVNADRLDEGVAGTAQTVQAVTGTANANYAISGWFKKNINNDWIQLGAFNGANSFRAWFNLNTGVKGSTGVGGTGAIVTSAIVAYPNGWYRCIVVGSVGSAATAISGFFSGTSADNVTTRVNNASYFAWGQQFEDNTSWPSSYLPTTIATVTRSTDVLLCSGLGAYFTADGSWYAESISDQTSIINPRVIGVTGPKGILTHNSGINPAGPGVYGASMWDNVVSTNTANIVASASSVAKMCAKYTVGVNAAKLCMNGGAVASGNTNAFSGETTIGIGVFNAGGATGFYGVIRKVHGWQRQIPDAYMQRLTT